MGNSIEVKPAGNSSRISWTNDCVDYSGQSPKLKINEKTSQTTEAALGLGSDRDSTLISAIIRLDRETVTLLPAIKNDLKTMVVDYMITPVMDMLARMNCQFIGAVKNTIVDGLCWQMNVGMMTAATCLLGVGIV